MEPVITATLLVGLGQGLVKVFEKLLEKGVVDPALERGLEPLRGWVGRGYDREKDEAALRQAVLDALGELEKDPQVGDWERLQASLKFTGRSAAELGLLAAASVEMTHFEPQRLPPVLLKSLGIEEQQRDLLARFLFYLRKRLAETPAYQEGITYADRLEQRGLLVGLTQGMLALAERAGRLVSIEEAIIAERHLTTDDEQALRNYLADVRQRWGDLMLPLIRKRSGEAVHANLKQVFVPLSLRDVQAEQAARQRMERQARQKQPAKIEKDEAERPIGLGELLNRCPRFSLIGPPGCGKSTLLNRAALAFAEGRAGEDLGWRGGNLLPVCVRLRNFGAFLKQRGDFPEPSSGALVAYLDQHFRVGQRLALTADFFDRRLKEGNCLVLLDGLDEVSENRELTAQHVNAFIVDYGRCGNRFGLASRPRGYESVAWQLRPAGLVTAEVNPLEAGGIRQLIANLLALIEPQARQRAQDIERLAQAILDNPELVQVAGTPLFCSALVQVYKYHGAELPQRRVDVFDEIVDLLLGFWRAQQQSLAGAAELAAEDGTARKYRDINEAVAIKQRRLSYLAYQMQDTGLAEIQAEDAAILLSRYLQERERVADPVQARQWAESFLQNSHECSGLLVERDPGVYAFIHKGFMEFLAASALVNRSQALVEALLAHVGEDWWEQVILLAGAHPRLADDLRSELVNRLLDQAAAAGGDERQRGLLTAGRLARDMADYLPGPEHERAEQALHAAMTDPDLEPVGRAAAADVLDELGWLPPDLYQFVRIDPPGIRPFYLGKYLVTNLQYARFLQAEDFADPELWRGFPKFDENSRPMQGDWGEQGWKWLQDALKSTDSSPDGRRVDPSWWNDPRFGIARKGIPVVGVNWYEANAYCRWLLRHWAELEEGQINDKLQPESIRLPTEAEWLRAAGGEKPQERYPWDQPGQATNIEEQILRRANVYASRIGRSTPVGMYPLGASQPYGLWDLAGNAWEWHANFSDEAHKYPGFRGGSWVISVGSARPAVRDVSLPDDWPSSLGFRVVVLVALPS